MKGCIALLLLPLALFACRQDEPAPAKKRPASPQAASAQVKSSWRFIDKTGKVVIEPEYNITYGFGFAEGTCGVKNEYGLLGFIDKQGRTVIQFGFSDGTSFSEGSAGVLKNNMCGYIDGKGKLIIPLKYDSVSNFKQGWGNVKRGGAWTFVDVHGKELGQWYADSKSFSEGLAVVAPAPSEEGGVKDALRYGFIGTDGKMAIAPQYDDARPFSSGFAAVQASGKWGYINKNGKMIIQPQFDAAGPFSEGLAQIQIGTRMGYVDETGKMAIDPRFELDTQQEDPDEEIEMTGKFVDGLACVRFAVGPESNGGWGFIDKTGKFVIPPRYENADMFSEGLASVQYKGRWGFVDPKGTLVIPPKYDSVKRFSEGLAMVQGGR